MVTIGDVALPCDYRLGVALDDLERAEQERRSKSSGERHKAAIVQFLLAAEGRSARQQDLLKGVKGKTESVLEAIRSLEAESIITVSGRPAVITALANDVMLKFYQHASIP